MTARTPGDGEAGMILVNVLLIVAIASAAVLLLINREQLALDGALRMREAARAMAVARGGELSAITALSRDAAEAPSVDHRGEGWARIEDRGRAIDGGRFDLVVADAESRFNINLLRTGEASAVILFQQLAREAGLDDDRIIEAMIYVRTYGPITDLRPLRQAGIAPEAADRLSRLVTALPGRTTINLNAATPEVMLQIFREPAKVARLLAIRERQGYLSLKELADEQLAMPAGTSFRSGSFWVRARVTIGGTSQQVATLIQRRASTDGTIETVPVARWINAAVPPDAPAL